MAPGVRKLALTLHVMASVGWLGAVAAFLALAVAGLTGRNPQTVSAAYVAMGLTGSWILVPLSFASLLSGLVQALGTPWGLFRHYWVVVKLAINLLATFLLLLHLRPISYMADLAAGTDVLGADLYPLRLQLAVTAGAALIALVTATALSVYKPKGLTPYGWRKQKERRAAISL